MHAAECVRGFAGCTVSLTPGGNKSDVMKRSYHLSSLHTSSGPHLSITARHSFLQVKRLPRRRRKVPGAVVRGGGVCLHSISSRGNGAGRMFRVAPAAGGLLSQQVCRCRCGLEAQVTEGQRSSAEMAMARGSWLLWQPEPRVLREKPSDIVFC